MIDWYRTPLPPALFKQLHERSNWRGLVQTVGFMAITATFGLLTYWSWRHWAWPYTLLFLFAYGTVAHFYVNGMHELSHGTVFKTRALTAIFVRVVSFLGWHHPEAFSASHQRHHRYTLHPPDDQEVVLPMKLSLRNFIVNLAVNPGFFWWMVKTTWRIARGRFETEWDLICFPPDQPKLRETPIRWARLMLGLHVLIAVVSIACGQWIIPVIVSFGPFVGGWLFFLCNNSQHAAMLDNVSDFRLCCRTIRPNPLVRFIYWQMNFHIEHHMYASVPCYNLKRLHEAIRHDLPPTRSLLEAWRCEIVPVLRRQAADPAYKPVMTFPSSPATA